MWINGKKHQKPNTKTNAELVVFLHGLWLEGSGAGAEGMGAPDEGGAREDGKSKENRLL
ncbi:hypothetical protein PISMIDRAFT_687463 [Pisolithus microcarpus 441]|uniref:Uncharacterized protein n=1 Tax=Pisolithus microcarpus 441 TaxID=765257 RepID=A0A0C9YEY5_9AGAM|nr:hypothetical protein BKA83DRAFT_687463 [Pisolithus microcarpus]KIK15166.1 hypothetical protein PISMIDRAFT_687463 [Pisolithus microcarpus 441]